MRRLAICAVAVLAGACSAAGGNVTRIVDGSTIDGRFVSAQAYAAFLRGAIAEGNGALLEAARSYELVAEYDRSDPEVFARLARVRCALDPHDARARAALGRAFALDPDYGNAWGAAAACGGRDDVDALARASRGEPRDVSVQVAFAQALERSSSAGANAARARLLELTLEQPASSEALGALASWADAHDDLDLLVRALREAAQRAPRLDPQVARATLALAGEGQFARARRVAAALLDARARRDRGSPPLDDALRVAVGRLAVDEAAERDDEDAVRRRAVVGRLTPAEAATRAALASRFELAARLAEAAVRADPNDVGARMVLASAAEARGSASADLHAAFDAARPTTRASPAGACGLLARALLRSSGVDAARAVASSASCDPIAPSDASVVSLFVDLAARDVVAANALPVEGRIELAWRTRVALHEPMLAGLDVRHELLAAAQSDPMSARAGELAAKLARRGPTDPIVLASLLAVAHARGQTLDEVARAALAPPASAVLDATLLDTLPKTAPERVHIRARFAALAATPAERALIH